MRRSLALLMLPILAACDAPPQNVVRMQNLGHYHLVLDPTNQQRIAVQMLNLRDPFAPNIDITADRHDVARQMVRQQCGEPQVIADRYTRTGGIAASNLRTYIVEMTCPNGATTPAR